MRLVSQDETYDFPYEHVVVYRNETSVVCGIMPDIREKVLLGKYNSKAKALKAMKMLREEYQKYYSNNGGGMMATAALKMVAGSLPMTESHAASGVSPPTSSPL